MVDELACLKSSWTTLIFSPLVASSVASDLLNVCQPTVLSIPAARTAGRIYRCKATLSQIGVRPPVVGLAKTQSSSPRYRDSRRQSVKASARSWGMGIPLREASVFNLVL